MDKILILFFLSSFFFLFNNYFAKLLNLYDIPDKNRKLHKTKTPLTGGLLIFLGFFLYIFLSNILLKSIFFEPIILDTNFFSFYIGFTLFFLIGILDDKLDLNANLKILFFVILILFLLIVDKDLHIKVIKLGFLQNNFSIGSYSYIWTLVCFLLFINAINMFDGVNGQTGLYFLICMIYILISNSNLNYISLIFIFPLIIFLFLNLTNKCFIGNSGTYSLSFVVAYLFIKSYNLETIYLADEIVLLMLLPGLDLIRLFIFRILKKRNPFSPDRNHLHHYLLKKYKQEYIFLFTNLFIITFVLLGYYTKEYIYMIFLKAIIYIIVIFFLKKKFNV